MKNKFTLIDTAGQLTAIFFGNLPPRALWPNVSSKILERYKNLGQVAFLQKVGPEYQVEMMGGELSINGTLATAYLIGKQTNKKAIKLKITGLGRQIKARLKGKTITLFLPTNIVQSIQPKLVALNGIKYLLSKGLPREKILSRKQKAFLKQVTRNTPAAGIIFYDGDKIIPVIYVKKTNSLVWETACGSGSLAYFLVSGNENVIQPSGKTVKIAKKNDTLVISMPIKEVKS